MNIHSGFIKDICTNPNDDIPRLIYADWLQDHEEGARVEFIRLQIKLKSTPKNGCTFEERGYHPDCERCILKKRELELYTANWAKWWPKELDRIKIIYSGGFVETITLTCDDFIKFAKEIFSFCPIKEVILKDKKPIIQYKTYWWFVEYSHKTVYSLPQELFRLMLNYKDRYAFSKEFDDEESALSCLNHSCLVFGRRSAWSRVK